MKKTKGITLITLIITIVILLVLSAVTIMGLANNGVFNTTKIAVNKTKEDIVKEQIILDLNKKAIEKIAKVSDNEAYEIISVYDKEGKIRDHTGQPYIETKDGVKISILDVYDFNEIYLIQKEYPNAVIVSEGSDIATFDNALNLINSKTDTKAMIYLNNVDVEWSAENALLSETSNVTEELIICGSSRGVSFTATGSEYAKIRTANGAGLQFKNIEIIDATGTDGNGSWETGYLECIGQIKFENCQFAKGIQIGGDNCEVEFTNCDFHYGGEDSMYGVWISDGKVKFENCRFDGKRFIKVHEAYGSNVDELIIENCEFDLEISLKPCLAIGTIDASTIIALANNKIYYYEDSASGDQGLYIYEYDTEPDTFVFTETNNSLIYVEK